MSINVRRKGVDFEQNFCKYLRALGWDAITTREGFKRLDNKKVDILTNAPFAFQLKRMEKLRPSAVEILESMPVKKNKPRVLIHKVSHKPTTVTMLLKDFELLHLVKNPICQKCNEIKCECNEY